MNQKSNRIKQILVVFILIAAVEGFSSCEKYSYAPPAVDPNATWHLQTEIQPIFNANCVTCHNGTKSPDLREGKAFLSLTRGGYVSPLDETSSLYSTMIGPDHAARSTAADKLKVLYWIRQGALNN